MTEFGSEPPDMLNKTALQENIELAALKKFLSKDDPRKSSNFKSISSQITVFTQLKIPHPIESLVWNPVTNRVKDVSKMFHGCFKDVVGMFHRWFKDVSKMFYGDSQEWFKGVSRVFQGCFKFFSRKVQDSFKDVSRVFQRFLSLKITTSEV